MLETIFEIIKEAVLDSLKMLPFLFGAYLFIEFLEHKASDKLTKSLQNLGPFGSIGGAALGCIPQCGFSVAAANLYAGRLISIGTLMAVFLATSDEAIPIILANPKSIGVLWKLILAKLVIAAAAGFLIDFFLRSFGRKKATEVPFEELCADCDCEHGILHSAIKHTVNIFVFILLVNLGLTALITLVGQDVVFGFLASTKLFQPFIAGLIGLVPNCASSVILTQTYLQGGLTFGSVVAGLSTGAGLGIVVLFKANKHIKQNLLILGGLYAIGVFAGVLIDLIGLK